ncbi:MAG: hypothetical protein R2748_26040 [Bryobacterales bacterium]
MQPRRFAVFVAAQRFDSASFDSSDTMPLAGAMNEAGIPVTFQDLGNYRATIGMFGSGYIEMLARQITADLQDMRDARWNRGRRRRWPYPVIIPNDLQVEEAIYSERHIFEESVAAPVSCPDASS